MYNIYELEQTATSIWSTILKITGGDYEERPLTDRECQALRELVEAAEEIISQKDHIEKLKINHYD